MLGEALSLSCLRFASMILICNKVECVGGVEHAHYSAVRWIWFRRIRFAQFGVGARTVCISPFMGARTLTGQCFMAVHVGDENPNVQPGGRRATETRAGRFIGSLWDEHMCCYTERVAIAGGTAAARRAGPNTAICPSSHRATAPIGR